MNLFKKFVVVSTLASTLLSSSPVQAAYGSAYADSSSAGIGTTGWIIGGTLLTGAIVSAILLSHKGGHHRH